MRYQIGASITFGLALILSAPLAGHAQSAGSENTEGPPALTLPFDGRVSGSEIGEDPELVFRIYDQQTGGNLLFEERQTPHITNGSYTVLIGAATPGGIPAPTLQSDFTLWIEASGAGAPMDHTPRVLASNAANAKEQSLDSSQSDEPSETVPDPIDKVPRLVSFQLRNLRSGRCLDSDDHKAGVDVCRPTDLSQKWSEYYRIYYPLKRPGTISTSIHLRNSATGYCLDSHGGQVSANPCQPNRTSQTWVTRAAGYGTGVTFRNSATGFCLAVDPDGHLGTGDCNSPHLNQLWVRRPSWGVSF